MKDLTEALQDFAVDEGVHSAIVTAEKWRDSLEEMVEVCNRDQVEACNLLLKGINTFIERFVV